MITFSALFLWILSAVYPTFRTTGTLDGNSLTLKLLMDKPSVAYKVDFLSIEGVALNGNVSATETAAHMENAFIPNPDGESRTVTLPDTSVELDANIHRPGDAEPFIPLDLFRIVGKSEFTLRKNKPLPLAESWKTSKLHGMATYKGLVDGHLVVETTGHVIADGKECSFNSTLNFPVEGGAPQSLIVEMKLKGEPLYTVRLDRAGNSQ